MSSIPPPRAGLVKGDYVLISGIWFEMKNSAPQRRPSAAKRSISDFNGNDTGTLRGGRASTSSEIESKSHDRSAHSHTFVKRDDQVIKPRLMQTRSDTGTSAVCSSKQVPKSQYTIDGGEVTSAAHCTRDHDLKNPASLGNSGKIQISKPEHPIAVSTSTSSSGNDEREIAEENSKTGSPHKVESSYRNWNGYIDAADSIQHQIRTPDASPPPRPRNKLRKGRKGMRDGSEACVCACGGGKGPGLLVP